TLCLHVIEVKKGYTISALIRERGCPRICDNGRNYGGSYECTAVPTPNVDCTRPEAPAPAPPAPAVVPPAPAPGAPVPNPPTPPPGVPCTTPAFTPRKTPPALVRRMSISAIGRL